MARKSGRERTCRRTCLRCCTVERSRSFIAFGMTLRGGVAFGMIWVGDAVDPSTVLPSRLRVNGQAVDPATPLPSRLRSGLTASRVNRAGRSKVKGEEQRSEKD